MLPDPPDYEQIEKSKWRENARKVISQLDEGDRNLKKQIETFNRRFGYGLDEIEGKIRADEMFAANFAREPRRQGFHEIVARDWLEKKTRLNIEVLPKSGPNSFYVTRDGVITKIPREEQKPSKSLDFKWTHGNVNFYAMHKYTKEGGGNQDSQFKEMIDLLTNYQRATNPSNALIVIVDGPYYNQTRMQRLKMRTRTSPPLSFAVPIQEVPDILMKFSS